MRPDLYLFQPADGPAFEVWAPRDMQQVPAPGNIGALIADPSDGFAPNLVVGHDEFGADATLTALIARLQADAAALPGAEVQAGRTVAGVAGEVRIVAFIHDGPPESGRLYQMTAGLLDPAGHHLIYLTGTCTVEQMPTWDPAFVDAATSVRFS